MPRLKLPQKFVEENSKQTKINSFFTVVPNETNKKEEVNGDPSASDKIVKSPPSKSKATATAKVKSITLDSDSADEVVKDINTNNNISPTTTRSRTSRFSNFNSFISPESDDDDNDNDSDDEKDKKTKRTTNRKSTNKKRKKEESDYESDGDEESYRKEEEDYKLIREKDNSDVDIDVDDNNDTTNNIMKLDGKTLIDDIDMTGQGERIQYGTTGRVLLPQGTPTFTRDIKSGKKLIKSFDQVQKLKESNNNNNNSQEYEDGGGGNSESDSENDKKTKKSNTKGKKSNSKKITYTPLEQQYMQLKKDNPDTVLMIECGYKFIFFGEDAEIANKVLNIYAYVKKNFLNASIPIQRLSFHLRRLILAGYKVGVVEQTETAALKAVSTSKAKPFDRKLSRVYTSSTFIDDSIEDSVEGSFSDCSSNYLVSFFEEKPNSKKPMDEQGLISFVAVSIKTGEIIYDTFKDDLMRNQLNTILSHLNPNEILLPPIPKTEKEEQKSDDKFLLSNLTSKYLKLYYKSNSIRVQSMDSNLYDYDTSLVSLQEFYEQHQVESNFKKVVELLKKGEVICLGVLLNYLKQFIQFSSILKVMENFKSFKDTSNLILPHSTLQNLEILKNDSDHSEKGTLFWVMNKTKTLSGKRLFRDWICKPLSSLEGIIQRQESVQELLKNITMNSPVYQHIDKLFKSSIPDLQKNLSRIYYKSQCTPKEFLTTIQSFKAIVQSFNSIIEEPDTFQSTLLKKQIFNPTDNENLMKRINYYLSTLNSEKAMEYQTLQCEKSQLWSDRNKFPKLNETIKNIDEIKEEFQVELKSIRKLLSKPLLEYVHMPKLNYEYVIELPNSFKVPKDWEKVGNSTKLVSRYHTPFVKEKLKLLCQHRETLQIQSQEAWVSFLSEFTDDYVLFSRFIQRLSILDCLVSLGKVSSNPDYVKPEFIGGDNIIEIEQGRHPIVELLLDIDGSYIPNSISLSSSGERSMIITGPNMGGKSSFIRQTSLIVIMAQMGCNVPAKSCKLGVIDGIYTRMGAHDDISKGSSTFFVELQETSEILKKATSRSLVILDELGRGTSTHDGVAIAYSTLKYITERIKCFCLFVTHYPSIAQLENQYPNVISNYHMGFIESLEKISEEVSIPRVMFLYKIVKGAATNSYGLNVATLSGIPKEVLIRSQLKSNELRDTVNSKLSNNKESENLIKDLKSLLNDSNNNNNNQDNILLKLKNLQIKLN